MNARLSTARNTLLLIALAALGLMAFVGTAGAKTTIKEGRYVTTSGPKFSFTVKKKLCPILPTNYKKRASKPKKRYCFTGGPEEFGLTLICPQAKNYEYPFGFFLFSRVGLSSTGKATAIAWTYTGNPDFPDPIGDTTVRVEVSGKKASGYLQVRNYGQADKPCDTGQIAFKAKLK